MDKNKVLSMLGLARRAGRLSMGHDAATQSIINGNAKLIIFCSDISPRLIKEFCLTAKKNLCAVSAYQADITINEIHMAIGYKAGVIAVNDINFAVRIKEMINTEDCIW